MRHSTLDDLYRRRVLASAVAALLLVIAIIRGWPAPSSSSDQPFRGYSTDRIQIEEVQPTDQPREQNPPPPAPLPPVVVPNDVIVEETFEVDESALQADEFGDDPEYQEGDATAATAARKPDRGARLLRNVQPRYPPEAQDDDIRARVRVRVKVSAEGRVQGATILGRWRLSETGTARPVSTLGYGLDEAALDAARRSLFRPAHHRGEPVATQTTITFTFGR